MNETVACAPVACDCASIRFRSTGETSWTSRGIYRERECLACHATFWTLEVRITKRPGKLRARHKPERCGMRAARCSPTPEARALPQP